MAPTEPMPIVPPLLKVAPLAPALRASDVPPVRDKTVAALKDIVVPVV